MTGKALGAVLAAALLLGACAPIYRNHGYVPSASDLATVAIGADSRDEVLAKLGRPTTAGVLGDATLYYVQSRFRHYGPFAPQEVRREVRTWFPAVGDLRFVRLYRVREHQLPQPPGFDVPLPELPPGLVLAGEVAADCSIDGSIASGLRAAEKVVS